MTGQGDPGSMHWQQRTVLITWPGVAGIKARTIFLFIEYVQPRTIDHMEGCPDQRACHCCAEPAICDHRTAHRRDAVLRRRVVLLGRYIDGHHEVGDAQCAHEKVVHQHRAHHHHVTVEEDGLVVPIGDQRGGLPGRPAAVWPSWRARNEALAALVQNCKKRLRRNLERAAPRRHEQPDELS